MGEWELVRFLLNYGYAGAVLWVAYKLLDKWAPKFLAAHNKQAESLAELAAAVKSGQGEQRDVLLAVRVMATKVDELRETVGALDQHVRGEVRA